MKTVTGVVTGETAAASAARRGGSSRRRPCVAAAALALALAACTGAGDGAPRQVTAAAVSAARAALGSGLTAQATLCGPAQLAQGEAQTMVCDLAGSTDGLSLVGWNGGLDGGTRVASGVVSVNGTEVLGQNNFGENRQAVYAPFVAAAPGADGVSRNILSADLHAPPGSQLVLGVMRLDAACLAWGPVTVRRESGQPVAQEFAFTRHNPLGDFVFFWDQRHTGRRAPGVERYRRAGQRRPGRSQQPQPERHRRGLAGGARARQRSQRASRRPARG